MPLEMRNRSTRLWAAAAASFALFAWMLLNLSRSSVPPEAPGREGLVAQRPGLSFQG